MPKGKRKVGILVQGGFEPWGDYEQEEIDSTQYPTSDIFLYTGVGFLIAHSSHTELPYNVYLVKRNKGGGIDALVKEGDTLLAGASVDLQFNQWYRLRLDVDGARFAGHIDGEKVLEYNDSENPEEPYWPSYADQYHVGLMAYMDIHKVPWDPEETEHRWGDEHDPIP